MYHYTVKPCRHTICTDCLYDAVLKKVESQQDIFICPRCPAFDIHEDHHSVPAEQKCTIPQTAPSSITQDQTTSAFAWPDGTESWHLHEIRSQRESFVNKIDPEPLIITPASSVEREHQSVERVQQLDRDLSEPTSKVDQILVLPNQAIKHFPDVVDVDTDLREPSRPSETPN
ncbi:unnamed protein product [Adineta steineri]|uniref:RING-type domain-containing protein n=1 Tax=Adineta steineri TaxID=433720 RepID=A0A814F668_9BILA|nr:unnamed protein product [Adineta steineri]CAF0975582.1 unnamed protein product [Adineta steineri]